MFAFSWIFIFSLGFAEYSNVHTILFVKTGISQLNVVTKFSLSPNKSRDVFIKETGCLCGGTNTDGLTEDVGEARVRKYFHSLLYRVSQKKVSF